MTRGSRRKYNNTLSNNAADGLHRLLHRDVDRGFHKLGLQKIAVKVFFLITTVLCSKVAGHCQGERREKQGEYNRQIVLRNCGKNNAYDG